MLSLRKPLLKFPRRMTPLPRVGRTWVFVFAAVMIQSSGGALAISPQTASLKSSGDPMTSLVFPGARKSSGFHGANIRVRSYTTTGPLADVEAFYAAQLWRVPTSPWWASEPDPLGIRPKVPTPVGFERVTDTERISITLMPSMNLVTKEPQTVSISIVIEKRYPPADVVLGENKNRMRYKIRL